MGSPVSGISLPIEYRMTLGWLRSLRTIASMSASHHSGKTRAVVVAHLRVGPHVERLVHDEHAETVARVEQRLARRMVRAADGVEARRLQDLDAALVGALDRRRPDHAVVVMDARAAEVHDLTVDPQAPSRVELQRPDPEGRLVTVHLDAVDVTDHDPARVQGRRIHDSTGAGRAPPSAAGPSPIAAGSSSTATPRKRPPRRGRRRSRSRPRSAGSPRRRSRRPPSTSTTARSSSISGVVTHRLSSARCTGSPTTSFTFR